MARRKYPEHEICVEIVRWFRTRYGRYTNRFFHITNEQNTTPQAGWRLNQIGRMTGVADYHLAVPCAPYPCLWLEIKTEKGQLSESQQFFLEEMRAGGYGAAVAYGYFEAIEILEAWMSGDISTIAVLLEHDKKSERKKYAAEGAEE